MTRQCLMAVVLHQLSAEGGSQQSKTQVLLVNGPTEEMKCEDLDKIVVGNVLEKFFQVRAQLYPQEKEELIQFLMKNDVFMWSAYEAPRWI